MDQILLTIVLGLGTGALIAGVAVALVVTYRGSGVINLAAGAVSMFTGYAFWALREGSFGHHFGTVPSFAIAVAVAAGSGVFMEVLAFRPLRTAAPLAKLVASLGVFLLAQAVILLAFGPEPQIEPSMLPRTAVTIFNVFVPIDRFIVTGVVIVFACVLAVIYRMTRFGLATRAAAENEVSAMLAGHSPNRLSMINTVAGCVIAGVLGVLAAPLITLDPQSLPLIVVPALAAALLGRFDSLGIACLAGLALGIGENLVYYASTQSWFPTDQGVPMPGVAELLVFLVVVAALFWRGANIPDRGACG